MTLCTMDRSTGDLIAFSALKKAQEMFSTSVNEWMVAPWVDAMILLIQDSALTLVYEDYWKWNSLVSLLILTSNDRDLLLSSMDDAFWSTKSSLRKQPPYFIST